MRILHVLSNGLISFFNYDRLPYKSPIIARQIIFNSFPMLLSTQSGFKTADAPLPSSDIRRPAYRKGLLDGAGILVNRDHYSDLGDLRKSIWQT